MPEQIPGREGETVEILGQPLLASVVDGDEFDRYRVAPGDDAVIVNCPRDECGAIVLVEESPTLGDVMDAAVDHEGDAHGGYKPITCEVVDTPHGPAAVQADGPLTDRDKAAMGAVVEAASKRFAIDTLTWLISAGVDVTIGATSHQGGAALKVSLDAGGDPAWKGDHLADLLAQARAWCESAGVTP
ncbi:hypothetical protein J5X84_36280 [Streptosporangiaceae bacterium NEAU-GS5]|nr:hypothetical protein [Streptosporangiaceae bacterium NEAU-GS5]